MNHKILIVLVYYAFAHGTVQGRRPSVSSDDCIWNRATEFPKYPSLLIESEPWKLISPMMHQKKKVIRIRNGATVVVACPDSSIVGFPDKEAVEGVCNGGKTLTVGTDSYDMNDLGCIKRPQESVKRNVDKTGEVCGKGFSLNSIGFDIQGYGFYDLIKVCFDPELETTVSTSHILTGISVTSKDKNPSRPNFEASDGLYSVNPNNCYDQDSQIALMQDLLGDSSVIDIKKSFYFARGHLSPDADFLTELQADATYHYINVAPQWQSFNNGNWKYLEMAVRELAATDGGREFKIWTGPLGILELDDTNGNPVKIYLGLTEQKEVIPAPELYWKVIYEPSTNLGVAVIGVNNPYIKSFPKKLCPDVCDSIPWIDFKVNDLKKGAMYCCDIQSFRKAVPLIPPLKSPKLLTG